MHIHRGCGIVLAIACIAAPQKAATQDALARGTRVRVVEPYHFVRLARMGTATLVPLGIYELVAMAGDTVTVTSASSGPTAFVLGAERDMVISAGMHRRPLKGIGAGFLIGAAFGAGIGLLEPLPDDPSRCLFPCDRRTTIAISAIGLGAVGTVIGGISGLRKREVWKRIDRRRARVGFASASFKSVRLSASLTL